MSRRRFVLLPFTLAVLCLAAVGSAGRADFIEAAWHYDWGATPGEIVVQERRDPMTGTLFKTTITLTNEANVGRVGGSNTVATNIITSSNSPRPVEFHDVPYSLTLKITDDQADAPNNFAILTFSGKLSGTISKNGSLMTNVFDQSTDFLPSFMVGENSYQVKLDSFVAPSGPGAGLKGAIGGTVLVNGHFGPEPPPPTDDTPEPGTLLLASLGLSSLGLLGWCKRARRRASVSQ